MKPLMSGWGWLGRLFAAPPVSFGNCAALISFYGICTHPFPGVFLGFWPDFLPPGGVARRLAQTAGHTSFRPLAGRENLSARIQNPTVSERSFSHSEAIARSEIHPHPYCNLCHIVVH